MRQTTGTRKSPGEKIVKDIKRATRKHYSRAIESLFVLFLYFLTVRHPACSRNSLPFLTAAIVGVTLMLGWYWFGFQIVSPVSAFISPLLVAIPHTATAVPLVLIGAFMMSPACVSDDLLH